MGLFDKLKGVKSKAADVVEDNEEKIEDAIDKAADFVDDKTGGKHTDKIDKAADAAKSAVEKLADSD
jgi:ABC-type transporter Mla subunit MlaD